MAATATSGPAIDESDRRPTTAADSDSAATLKVSFAADVKQRDAPEPEPEPQEQFTGPRTDYYTLKRVRWDGLSLATRLQLYRQHGHAGHEGAEATPELPPIPGASPRPADSHSAGMEPSLKRYEPWEMHPSVRRMTDAVLDQAMPACEFSDTEQAHFAKKYIKGEIAKMNREAWEREQRRKEAAKYAPPYYQQLLDQSINHALFPQRQPGNTDAIKSANLASTTGLNFGSQAYRRHLSARIARARGEMGEPVPSVRGTGLSKTLSSRPARPQGTPLKPHSPDTARSLRGAEAGQARQLRTADAHAPQSAPPVRLRGRRPRMVVRIADQTERDQLSAR